MFYRIRDEYNPGRGCLTLRRWGGEVLRAAQTIFLNRTRFNGLYRVNSKGTTTSPWQVPRTRSRTQRTYLR